MFIVTISQDGDGEDYSDIIQEYRRRGLKIIHINSKENGGPGIARQRGIDANRMCDYIMFLDADDMYMPRAIETMYREAKINNADIVSSDFIAEQNHSTGAYLDSMTTSVTWCHNKIYRAAYLKKIGIRFPSNLRLNEDAYFNLVAVNCTENKKYIHECTYLWRDNTNSLTRYNGLDNFFNRSWEIYILCQVMGINKIIEILGTIKVSTFAQTLCNLYYFCMRALYKKFSLDYAKSILRTLGKNEVVKNLIDSEEFWKVVNEKLRASEITENVMIFYKMRFCDWLDEFILGEDE